MFAGWLSKATRPGGGSALTALGAAGFLCALLSVQSAFADTTTLSSSKDNTIFEDFTGNSNGAGPVFFVGNNGSGSGFARRGLIAFDLSTVPKGATVTSVKLNLRCTRTPPSPTSTPIELHRLLHSWGEATSNSGTTGGKGVTAASGDATWNNYSNPSGAWIAKGGDFDSTFSVRTNVSSLASYTFGSTPRLVSDVQGWLDDPLSNNGWILTGNEVNIRTARQFASRQNPTIANRPTLTIDYTVPEPHTGALGLAVCASALARRRRRAPI
jgi:hypothetical protein